MPLEPESDLHWTAFLYMSGDLDADEASAFEARLADDPTAREALVDAVDLAEALAVVGPEFRARRRPIVRLVVAASVFAAAACVALSIGLRHGSTPSDRPDASDVALAWSSLRAGDDADGSAVLVGSPMAEVVQSVDLDAETDAEVDASADRALPSWLLSATSASPEEPGEDE